MFKFDDAAYAEGRKAYEDGQTLRALLESFADEPKDDAEEQRQLSRAIGFADGLIKNIRGR